MQLVVDLAAKEGYKITDGPYDPENYGMLPDGTPKWLDLAGFEKV